MTFLGEKIARRVETLVLLTGVTVTGLCVDVACLQPFRDEKEALFIWMGGLLGFLAALGFFRGRIGRAPDKILILLIPMLGIGVWRLYESLGSRGGFGFVEPGLPAETDYLLRFLAYPLAGILFWLCASHRTLSNRRASFLGTAISVLSGILALGAGVEIVGDLMGREWRPFLLGAFVVGDQGTLKTNYFASIGNSNFLAGYVAILSLAVLGGSLFSRGFLKKIVGVGLFALMAAIVVVCRSKGALAGLAVGVVCLFGFHLSNVFSRKGRGGLPLKRVGGVLAMLAFVAVIALAIGLGSSKRRDDYLQVIRLRGESLSQRILLGYVGLEMWRESPWLGVGPGTYRLRFLDRVGELLGGESGEIYASRVKRLKSFKPVHVHNDYLETLIEWGVVGYLSCAAFLVTNLCLAWVRIRDSRGLAYGFRLGALSGAAAGLGYALFEFPLHLPSHLAVMAVFLGFSVAPAPGTAQAKRPGLAQRFLLGAPIAVLAAFLLWHGTFRALSSGLAGETTRLLEKKSASRNLAARKIRRASLADPGYADLNRLEALVEWRIENRPDAAVARLRRGAPLSDDPLFELTEAQIHLEESRYREAYESLSPLLAVAPYLPSVGYLEGRIYESRGALEKAKVAYDRDVRATRGRPEIRHLDLPHLYLRYGSVLERLGFYREAVRQYEKIADLQSDKPLALLRLGRLYRDRFQDLPTAERYFEKAMESARKSGNPAEEEQARKEILQLKKLRAQMRKEAILIRDIDSEAPGSNENK